MSAQRLLEHFDRLAESPDAVPRLRRFILDLAVRGRLVEQDPGDEPASALLKRIAQEKARQVQAGEIRKPRDLSTDQQMSEPFDIPASWRWCRLDVVGAVIGGGTPSAADVENFAEPTAGIPWLTPADLGGYTELYIARGSRDLSEKGFKTSSATMLPAGSVLFTSRAPIGYVAIAANPVTTNQGFKSIIPYVSECSRFIALAMKAFAPEINAKAPGTTFKEVSGKIVAGVSLPLPPLAEQHRIVAKVDELMALCDRLEAAQNQREQWRDQLVVASLRQLQDEEGPTPRCQDAEQEKEPDEKDLGALAPWRGSVFLQHIPRLTTRPEHIKALRQAILNLAVRGRLATQDPSDGSAQDFGIDTELDQNDRLALTLPENWSWAKVEHVAEARLGKMLDKAKNSGLYYRYLRNTNVHWFDIRTDDLKELRVEEADIQRYLLSDGDVIICEGGHGIGRTAVWRGKEVDIIFQKALHRVRPGTALDSDFLAYCLCAYFDAGVLQRYFTGVGIPHFTGKALSSLVFPLPPISEQHRIVAKVDELMAVCDQLEANLTATQTDSRRLLEAVLHEALAPARREAA